MLTLSKSFIMGALFSHYKAYFFISETTMQWYLLGVQRLEDTIRHYISEIKIRLFYSVKRRHFPYRTIYMGVPHYIEGLQVYQISKFY